MKSMKYPLGRDIMQAYQNRIDIIMKKLADRKAHDFSAKSFEVREVIGEYGFIMKQLSGIKDEKMLIVAEIINRKNHEQAREAFDKRYGTGMADFLADAVENFYQ